MCNLRIAAAAKDHQEIPLQGHSDWRRVCGWMMFALDLVIDVLAVFHGVLIKLLFQLGAKSFNHSAQPLDTLIHTP